MADAALKHLGIACTRLSASALGGEYEGDSLKALTSEYARLGRRPTILPMSALLIDDFDLSTARTDERLAGTQNSALLNGLLMHLADDPERIPVRIANANGTSDTKILTVKPSMIVLTANDVSCLYKPLTRPGRCRIFEWTPSDIEKAEIIHKIFPSLTMEEALELTRKYAPQPVSFYAQALVYAIEDVVVEEMKHEPVADRIRTERGIETIGALYARAHTLLKRPEIEAACERNFLSLSGVKNYLGHPTANGTTKT